MPLLKKMASLTSNQINGPGPSFSCHSRVLARAPCDRPPTLLRCYRVKSLKATNRCPRQRHIQARWLDWPILYHLCEVRRKDTGRYINRQALFKKMMIGKRTGKWWYGCTVWFMVCLTWHCNIVAIYACFNRQEGHGAAFIVREGRQCRSSSGAY